MSLLIGVVLVAAFVLALRWLERAEAEDDLPSICPACQEMLVKVAGRYIPCGCSR